MVTRPTTTWQDEQRRFADRDLSGVDYAYLWADGVHLTVWLDEDRICTLVMVGVRGDGKELVGLADGPRESTQSWADLLRDRRQDARAGARDRRPGAGVLGGAAGGVPGDPGAAGLGAQGDERARRAAQQRPASRPQPLAETGDAENRDHAAQAPTSLADLSGAKYPKAVAKVVADREQLLASHAFPAEHWVHKTSNPIASTLATVRLRTRVTTGPGRRAGHGLQAAGSRTGALALPQQRAPGRARPRRCHLRERSARRTARAGQHEGRHVINQGHAIHNP